MVVKALAASTTWYLVSKPGVARVVPSTQPYGGSKKLSLNVKGRFVCQAGLFCFQIPHTLMR